MYCLAVTNNTDFRKLEKPTQELIFEDIGIQDPDDVTIYKLCLRAYVSHCQADLSIRIWV